MELLITFIILNVVNVILQTFKTIATVKFGKWGAAIVNAVAFGLYTVVIVYTVCDLPLWEKVIIVSVANLFGVYVVKYIEEKRRKDKLWLVKITVPVKHSEKVMEMLKEKNIAFTYYDLTKYMVFDCFCQCQKETSEVNELCKLFEGKMFATENKLNY